MDLPRARIDTLPEYMRYKDKGCYVHPYCLSCPPPECILITKPVGRKIAVKDARATIVLDLLAAGLSVKEVADSLRISQRTVFRYVAGAR